MHFGPSEPDRLLQEAVAAQGLRRRTEAVRLLNQALTLDPRHLLALTTLAEAVLYDRDHATALRLLDQALAIEPFFAPAWNQRASACWLAGDRVQALEAARKAVDIQPPNPKYRLQLAQTAAWIGRGQECRAALAPLLANRDHDRESAALAMSMLGELAISEGRFQEADRFLSDTLKILPDLHATRMGLGMNQLRRGLFSEGWVNYAARELVPFLYPDGPPRWRGVPWTGEDLRGKSFLVADDQGRGDAIQFFRFLPVLRDRGAAGVTWLTFPELVRLLGRAAPYASVTGALPSGAAFDFECSSSALPRWLGTTLDSIPPPAPLAVTAKRRVGRRPLVGMAWSGDTSHTRDHMRSIPAAAFLRLADVPGIGVESLQRDVRPADLPALAARPRIGRRIERAADFADTAAVIAPLDLVVTVDTSVAHLAATMGKPVWIILHLSPDWRWLIGRTDSPWYPTVRLFRMRADERTLEDGGWGPVLGRVAAALRAFALSA